MGAICRRPWLAPIALLAACGGGSVRPAPAPGTGSAIELVHEPGSTHRRATSDPACSGERTFDSKGWRETRAGASQPPTGPSELAYRDGDAFKVAKLGTVPGARNASFEPLTISSTDRDADGTVVFVASWMGNPDQAHGIGRGIYRLNARGVETVVDAFTMVPGQRFRFNELGIPDIEQGRIAFWGGRGGGQWTGVYLWTSGTLVTIADQTGSVVPESGPDLRGDRVAFVGRDAKGPAAFVWWTEDTRVKRMVGKGDIMPDGKLIDHVLGVVLGDNFAAIAVGYDSVEDQRGIHMQRRIMGWHDGATWIVADPSWFKAPGGDALYLDPNPVIDGDAIAFVVAAGFYSELWVSEACGLHRVARSGDHIGNQQVRNFATLERESFRDGQIEVLANFTDGSQGYVRATRP